MFDENRLVSRFFHAITLAYLLWRVRRDNVESLRVRVRPTAIQSRRVNPSQIITLARVSQLMNASLILYRDLFNEVKIQVRRGKT